MPKGFADLGPREARRARVVDVAADQRVAELRQLAAERYRDAQLSAGPPFAAALFHLCDELIDRRQALLAHASISG
jgi:hypothetical protein